MVRNCAGRIRKFNPPTSSKERWGIERKAKNAVIQSLSSDMTKIAMGNLFLRLEPIGVKFVNTVHDELVFETSAEQAEHVASVVKEEMIKAGSYYLKNLPCDVSITISDH
jgi:DNA polymerase I-like protein with 3'-5' exonuclease and polymerase domains